MPVQVVFLNENVLNGLSKQIRGLGKAFAKRGALRQPMIKSIREVIIPSIYENFVVGGRPQWPELEPDTIMRRARVGRSEFLSNYDRLMASASASSPLFHTKQLFYHATAFARWKIKDNEAKYDFSSFPEKRWFAVVHDQPPIAVRANVPPRPFAVLQPEDIEDILRIFYDWVGEQVEKHLYKLPTV